MTSPGLESSTLSDAYIQGDFAGTLPFHSLLTYSPKLITEYAPPPKNMPKRGMRLAEKARILQRLLPIESEKRMDVATVLEETCKYIKFLTAQIRVLKSMPATASGGGDQDLDQRREAVLEAVVNSRAAQAEMYSRGCCVYSVDQLVLMNKENQSNRVAAFHHFMLSRE